MLSVCYSNLLEAESVNEYSCSVPLNIIIGVGNYTLRNGTEQSLEMAKHKHFFFGKKKKDVNFHEVFFIDNKPYTTAIYSLKYWTRTNNERSFAYSCSCSLPFIAIMQSNLHIESLVYLHAARVHFSNLLEAESSSGYSCFVPFR